MGILVNENGLTMPNGRIIRCAIGRGGIGIKKGEGDGITPIGDWPMRQILYRADKITKPESCLPITIINENDGWCDDPTDINYNLQIKLPYDNSHTNHGYTNRGYEKLWRDDNLYDLIVVLGHNDDPIINGNGSAIFLHVAKDGYKPTEGCVALAIENLLELSKTLTINDNLLVR